MAWRLAAVSCLMFVTVTPDAVACVPAPPEPRQQGESDAAYENRVRAIQAEREVTGLRNRQAHGMQTATHIFVGRGIDWSPPARRTVSRQLEPPPAPDYWSQRYSYFRPIAWLRGRPLRTRFGVPTKLTPCGTTSLGDTFGSKPGQRFVFFARSGLISEETLIDAIAVDRVTDPALAALVARSPR